MDHTSNIIRYPSPKKYNICLDRYCYWPTKRNLRHEYNWQYIRHSYRYIGQKLIFIIKILPFDCLCEMRNFERVRRKWEDLGADDSETTLGFRRFLKGQEYDWGLYEENDEFSENEDHGRSKDQAIRELNRAANQVKKIYEMNIPRVNEYLAKYFPGFNR